MEVSPYKCGCPFLPQLRHTRRVASHLIHLYIAGKCGHSIVVASCISNSIAVKAAALTHITGHAWISPMIAQFAPHCMMQAAGLHLINHLNKYTARIETQRCAVERCSVGMIARTWRHGSRAWPQQLRVCFEVWTNMECWVIYHIFNGYQRFIP